MNNALRRYIRGAEILAVSALSVAAFFTYRELESVRRVPVYLPNYEFEAQDDPDQGPVVRTRGTWIADKGPPEPLQTTTIECRKNRKECVESSASVVFVSGKGMLESTQIVYPIERWTDREIVTQATPGPCTKRVMMLDLAEKRSTIKSSAGETNARCTQTPERTLELVAGYRVRAEALKRPVGQ